MTIFENDFIKISMTGRGCYTYVVKNKTNNQTHVVANDDEIGYYPTGCSMTQWNDDCEEIDDWGEGERKTVRFYGDCKWSISGSINSSSYGNALDKTTKGLIVEMWSQEPGVGFEEHVVYVNGTCLCDDCVDYKEYDRNAYDSLEELNEEYGTNFKEEDFVDGFASVGGFEDFETFDDSDELGDEYFNL